MVGRSAPNQGLSTELMPSAPRNRKTFVELLVLAASRGSEKARKGCVRWFGECRNQALKWLVCFWEPGTSASYGEEWPGAVSVGEPLDRVAVAAVAQRFLLPERSTAFRRFPSL